jgi:hypothetical protein
MVNEYKLKMFLDSNQVSFKTDLLTGKLDSLIADTDNKIELIIESSLGYFIYKNKELYGIKYLCPRARTTGAEANLLDINEFVKFNLNEELYITAIGPKNTNIYLIFRFD